MVAQTFCGERGCLSIFTLNGDRASSIALASAGGGGIHPPSPTPLKPFNVIGDGVVT